jgi:hypothetical protein
MRELALLLLLANLGYFAWGLWISPGGEAAAPVAPAESTKVQRLVLLRELPASPGGEAVAPEPTAPAESTPAETAPVDDVPDAAAAVDVAAVEAAPGASVDIDAAPADEAGAGTGMQASVEPGTVALIERPPPPRCLSVGPFLDLAEAAEAAARLRERGHSPSQRLANSQVWMGNWVYLGPFSSREAAIGAAESLRAKGIADLYVEPAGEQVNTISLGLFSDRDGAETLAESVRKLGATPQIADRYRTASAYWVDVVVPADVSLAAADYQARPGRPVQVEEQVCADGAVAGDGPDE